MDAQLFTKAYTLIKNAKSILLVTHDRPDGDAVASVCLMAELLALLNKKYAIYCYDAPPRYYNFLKHYEEFKTSFNTFNFDLIIALDCGSLNRTKLTKEIQNRAGGQAVIEFDHHPKMDEYADIAVSDAGAASTTEILYQFLTANGITINKAMADCVLTGIITDTANFLYPATSSLTITIAAEMLSRGARFPHIMASAWRNKSMASMKTWGRAMSNLEINHKYDFAFTVLRQEDIAPELSDEELDGMAGFLSNLHDVKAVLLLRQLKDGTIKGSLRTAKADVDVSRLARLFGGGGHIRASGFVVQGQLEKTEAGWKII